MEKGMEMALISMRKCYIFFHRLLNDVHVKFSDGDKFDGEWRNDERHGKGAMIYCNGENGVQEKYEGEWVEGRMHGRCLAIYFLFPAFIIDIRGCYWYADGSMYDGSWVGGRMHGKGIFIYPNGNRFVSIYFSHLNAYIYF